MLAAVSEGTSLPPVAEAPGRGLWISVRKRWPLLTRPHTSHPSPASLKPASERAPSLVQLALLRPAVLRGGARWARSVRGPRATLHSLRTDRCGPVGGQRGSRGAEMLFSFEFYFVWVSGVWLSVRQPHASPSPPPFPVPTWHPRWRTELPPRR